MRIAVIGTGISGMTAALCLDGRHEVTVFEAAPRVGGHSNTVTVDGPEGAMPVDTGFIVCNPVNYPNFFGLMRHLGVALKPSDMSLGVSVAGGSIEWAGGDNLTKIFAQPGLMVSPSHLRMLTSVLRFNRDVKQRLTDARLPDITLGEFLEAEGYPMALRVRYVAAMAGPIWSTSTRGVMDFPFPDFARFFASHGLLNVVDRPQWMTVEGGSRAYVQAMLDRLGGSIRLGTAVQGLRRDGDGVLLRAGGSEARFDAVVCATHAPQALALLEDADAVEQQLLSAFRTSDNRAVLHSDTRLMPRRRRVWSSWNALLDQDGLSDAPIGVSYWMNRLQDLPGKAPIILSLNPPREPEPAGVHYETRYAHPLYTPQSMAAQRQLHRIQGQRRLWWAGAWTGYGFHEDGLKSGLAAAEAIDPACRPAWAA